MPLSFAILCLAVVNGDAGLDNANDICIHWLIDNITKPHWISFFFFSLFFFSSFIFGLFRCCGLFASFYVFFCCCFRFILYQRSHFTIRENIYETFCSHKSHSIQEMTDWAKNEKAGNDERTFRKREKKKTH